MMSNHGPGKHVQNHAGSKMLRWIPPPLLVEAPWSQRVHSPDLQKLVSLNSACKDCQLQVRKTISATKHWPPFRPLKTLGTPQSTASLKRKTKHFRICKRIDQPTPTWFCHVLSHSDCYVHVNVVDTAACMVSPKAFGTTSGRGGA